MARALEVPVVSLFGFTNPKRSGPYRRYGDHIVDGYARWAGEAYEPSPAKRPHGMGRVRAEMVLEKVGLALERYGGRR
jgi:heptosyltransferase I